MTRFETQDPLQAAVDHQAVKEAKKRFLGLTLPQIGVLLAVLLVAAVLLPMVLGLAMLAVKVAFVALLVLGAFKLLRKA